MSCWRCCPSWSGLVFVLPGDGLRCGLVVLMVAMKRRNAFPCPAATITQMDAQGEQAVLWITQLLLGGRTAALLEQNLTVVPQRYFR